jgi:hypothetical protein
MGFSDVSTKLLIVRSLEPIVRQGAQSPTDQLAIYFHHLIWTHPRAPQFKKLCALELTLIVKN